MRKSSEIGSHIKAVRKDLCKSQVKFSRLLKVSPPTISRYEAGKVTPPTHVLIELGNLAKGKASLWFWEQAGINSRAITAVANALAKTSLVQPKKGEMVRVPAFVGVGTEEERGEDLSLAAKFVTGVASASYFTVGVRTAGLPFMPGDILFLDESSRHADNLQPFWDQLVLVDSTECSDSAKRLWDQLIGKLVISATQAGAGQLAWSAIVQPWSVFERMEPFRIGFWSYEFLRGEKLAVENYPRKSRLFEETRKWAEERAKKDLRLEPGYRIMGRITGWQRPARRI